MTDPHTIDRLDERGRAAGRDLLHRADSRPRPTFDPDLVVEVASTRPRSRPFDRRSLLAVASVAAVVAALVGAALWVGGRDDGDQTPAAQLTSDTIRPYLPTVLPDGLDLAGVAELGVPDSATAVPGLGGLHTYGPAADDPRLGVLVMAEPLDDEATAIQVGDRTARLHDLGEAAFGPILELPTSTDTGPYLWFLGPDLTTDDLVTVAAGTTLDGYTPVIEPAALPDGWERQGAVASGMEAISPIAGMRAGASDHVLLAQYEGTASGRALQVGVSSQVDLVDAQRLFLADPAEVEVRGHRAVVGRWNLGGDADEMWVTRWVERPGEVLTVSGIGLSRDEVLAAAESLEPVDPTRWAELLEATALGDLGRGPIDGTGVELGRGEFDDGTAWVLRLSAPGSSGDALDGTLELDVAIIGDSESSSGSMSSVGTAVDEDGNPVEQPDRVFGTMTTLAKGGRAFATGLVRSDVTWVEVYAQSGAPLATPATLVTAEGHTAWVVELDGTATTIAAFGEGGAALAEESLPTFRDGRVDWDATGPTTTTGG